MEEVKESPLHRQSMKGLAVTNHPLSLTFDTLAVSNRSEADDILIAALGVTNPTVVDFAAAAICRRGSVRCFLELVRLFDQLSDAARRRFSEPSEALTRALRQSLSQGDESLILKTLDVIGYARRVDQIPAVVELLFAPSTAVRQEASEALAGLVETLYDQSFGPSTAQRDHRADHLRHRNEALDALSKASIRLDELPDPATIIEHLLALGSATHPAIIKVTRQSSPECRQLAREILGTSRRVGVIRLLLEYFNESYPPRVLFDALRTRDDPEFIFALLGWFPKDPTPTQNANLRQIDQLPWLSTLDRLAEIPEPLQEKLPPLVRACGLPGSLQTAVQEWLVRNGSASGRRGATPILDRLDLETTQRILLDSLDSPDEEVSAWATTQLRPRHIPGAFRMLIDRLDSPSTPVREAARAELRGFTIEYLVSIHDRLSPVLCRQAGQMVRKIDPDCTSKLVAMLEGPVQRQRIATVQAVGRLGMASLLRPTLLSMLLESDSVLRRTVVETLAGDSSPEVIEALQSLSSDSSVRVREAATRALAERSARFEPVST